MKKGLVIEGGGMRGAHTCGALMAMAERGLTDFDVIVAASAGACTASFFVSGQYDLFPLVWTKHLHDGRFINLRKLASSQSVMDLDFLIQQVFGDFAPLDIQAIQKSHGKFFIVATSCETGQPVYFDSHKVNILHALKASSALPIAYRHPVIIEGIHYIDGGISDPIPIQKAIDEGCDEIFVLLTRPAGYKKKSPFVQILPRMYQKKYPRVAEALTRRHEAYNSLLERIEEEDFPCKIRVVRPSDKTPVSRLTTSLKKIRQTIAQGYRDALNTLDLVRATQTERTIL